MLQTTRARCRPRLRVVWSWRQKTLPIAPWINRCCMTSLDEGAPMSWTKPSFRAVAKFVDQVPHAMSLLISFLFLILFFLGRNWPRCFGYDVMLSRWRRWRHFKKRTTCYRDYLAFGHILTNMHHLLLITVNFVGFLVIHISQGSVATYVRYDVMSYTALYSIFPDESVSERIFNIS